MADLETYLVSMLDKGGSDLHLCVGQPPRMRTTNRLKAIKSAALNSSEMEELLRGICTNEGWEKFLDLRELEFSHEISGLARFRANYFFNNWGMAAVFRYVPVQIISLDDLDLPDDLKKMCSIQEGLVLITGPSSSGKSSTVAAMIDYMNANLNRYIVTLEEPVEFVHSNKKCIIVHREIGKHSHSFADAITGAMRSGADVLFVSDMQDPETIKLTLRCAAMGMLALGVVQGNGVVKTLERMIDIFPDDVQNQMRTLLADSLRAVISQQLCNRYPKGKVVATEILLEHEDLSDAIRSKNIERVETIMQKAASEGMITMNSRLKSMVDQGLITPDEAIQRSLDKHDAQYLKLKDSADIVSISALQPTTTDLP